MTTPVALTRNDISRIFKRDDIRGVWPDELNCNLSQLIGRTFAEMLRQPGENRAIVVGHDARKGSFELLCALCQGIEGAGVSVRSIGLCSTEQIYYMAGHYPEKFIGGAMITASHNPAQYNGIKFVHAGALPFTTAELVEMRTRMENAFIERTAVPVGDEFARFMFDMSGFAAEKPLEGAPLKVVVLAGNGVGAKAFRPLGELLAPKGFEFIYENEEPDGDFPCGVPNPLLPAFNQLLGEMVRKHHAELGICFDGDADRAGFVDGDGVPLIPSQVLAIVALSKLASSSSASRPVVMRNLCCSHLLEDLFGDGTKAELVDTPVGHGQIKQLMRCDDYKSRVIFAGEHSGHYFYPEFFSVDSGILTSLCMLRRLKALKAQGRTLSQELAEWRKRYLWSGEINFRMPDQQHVANALEFMRHYEESTPNRTRFEIRKDPKNGLARVFVAEQSAAETAAPDVKIQVTDADGSGWWFVVRPSGNEPILRLNVEVWGKTPRDLEDLVATLRQTLIDLGATPA